MKHNPLLLDTHIWLWLISGNLSLPVQARKFVETAKSETNIYVSAISCWEIAMLEAKGRIILGMPCLEWINASMKLTSLEISPITPEVAVESCKLPENFHGDPADRLIVATARVHNLTLVTHDNNILQYGAQKHVSIYRA